MKPRIAQHDLQHAARGRVAPENRVDLFPDGAKHACTLGCGHYRAAVRIKSIHDHSELLWRGRRFARRRARLQNLPPGGARKGRHCQARPAFPYSIKILLENLLRFEDGSTVKRTDIEYVAEWDPAAPAREINFRPARVLLQDFTGVPCVVDLAAMRDALQKMGADPKKANPLIPVDLVIDHSVQVDQFGTKDAFGANALLEYSRNRERYAFLKWGQTSFQDFRAVPPDTGIVHQVNLEYLAPVVFHKDGAAYPDTVVGTDSHTTMINGLGVVGWGVGGIEAEACMLGQPATMLLPAVVGFKLSGRLPEGATATDLVLMVTQMLRKKGVVGKFVEFYGDGVGALSLADRATIANMAPEYGATIGVFPIDHASLDYLRMTNRPPEQIALVEAYAKEQGLFRVDGAPEPVYSDTLALDLAQVVPSLAGPKRPQDRINLPDVKQNFLTGLGAAPKTAEIGTNGSASHHSGRQRGHRRHHQLHQHLQSQRAGCGGTCSPRKPSSAD